MHTCPMRERILNNVESTLLFVSGVIAPKSINHKKSHTPNDTYTNLFDILTDKFDIVS